MQKMTYTIGCSRKWVWLNYKGDLNNWNGVWGVHHSLGIFRNPKDGTATQIPVRTGGTGTEIKYIASLPVTPKKHRNECM